MKNDYSVHLPRIRVQNSNSEKASYIPCSTPSAQVRSPQEFPPALPHLQNTFTLTLMSHLKILKVHQIKYNIATHEC